MTLLASCNAAQDTAGVVGGGTGHGQGGSAPSGASDGGTPGGSGAAPTGGSGGDPAGGAGGSETGGSSGTGGSETGGTGGAAPELYAGFRSSLYGIDPFPTPEWWESAARTYASELANAAPGGVWIVGVMGRSGTDCYLNFPSPGGSYSNISFGDSDENEAYLSHFDSTGVKVWLQVEPADADVETLIDLVLDQYGHHPGVLGFGVDVRWYRESSNQLGRAVTDAEGAAWVSRTRGHNPSYTFFLKHWLIDRMPPSERDGLWFIDDSQELPSMSELVDEFRDWGQHFAPSPVGFQIGYASDRDWWSTLSDPPRDLGQAIIDTVPNTMGMFWVDFTIREVF